MRAGERIVILGCEGDLKGAMGGLGLRLPGVRVTGYACGMCAHSFAYLYKCYRGREGGKKTWCCRV